MTISIARASSEGAETLSTALLPSACQLATAAGAVIARSSATAGAEPRDPLARGG